MLADGLTNAYIYTYVCRVELLKWNRLHVSFYIIMCGVRLLIFYRQIIFLRNTILAFSLCCRNLASQKVIIGFLYKKVYIIDSRKEKKKEKKISKMRTLNIVDDALWIC